MAEGSENIKNAEIGVSAESNEEHELSEEDRIEAEKVRKEISKKVSDQCRSFESDIRNVYNQRLASMEYQMGDNLAEKVTTAQMDILKVNKTFREISRPIGERWKELFKELTTDLPADKVTNEIKSIESKFTPLIQPYKSLMTWKELKGHSFQMEVLLVALEKMGMSELKKKAEDILGTKSCDDLIRFNSGGLVSADVAERVRRSRMGKEVSSSTTNSSSPLNPPSTTSNQPPSSPNQPSTTTNPSLGPLNPEEALDDRHLLFLSKKMIDCWDKVANKLDVPQQEVDDLIESEGVTNYQAAFRMLYGWRESNNNNDPHINLQSLISALQQIGRSDLIKTLH